MDLMVLAAFLHVSFMWCVSDRLLSKLTPWSQTLSVRTMTVLAKESFSILGVLVNLDVSSITSVSIMFHRITSSIQLRRVVRDRAWFAGSIAIYTLSVIRIKQFKLWRAIASWRGAIYRVKSNGTRIDPCGVPWRRAQRVETWSPMTIDCRRFSR